MISTTSTLRLDRLVQGFPRDRLVAELEFSEAAAEDVIRYAESRGYELVYGNVHAGDGRDLTATDEARTDTNSGAFAINPS